ncbi:MAG: PEP-CTERM sorting domain-containing protein [Chthoniobacter sp.]
MPAPNPENTPAAVPANDSNEPKKPGLLAHLWAMTPKTERFLFWAGLSLLLTCGVPAASHFLDGAKPNSQATGGGSGGGQSSGWGSGGGGGGWWNRAAASIEATATPDAPSSDQPVPSPSSKGSSLIPIDHGANLFSGSLTLGAPVPISAGSSREAYAILGLGTKSSLGIGGGPPGISSSSIGGSDLHFSLAGDLNLVPVDNLAAGGLSLNLLAVPEPSIGGLMAAALTGLALRRHRRPELAA